MQIMSDDNKENSKSKKQIHDNVARKLKEIQNEQLDGLFSYENT